MLERIKELIAQYTNIDSNQINENMRFIGDLGMDSFELMNLIADIEELLGVEIGEREVWQLQTLGDVRNYLEKNYKQDITIT